MLQKVLVLLFSASIDSHVLSDKMAVKQGGESVIVSVSVPGAASVILGARLVESLLHLHSLVKSVWILGW